MESVMKRGTGLKDSSKIAAMGGGIGGLMDKYDSVGVAAMVLSVFIVFTPYDTVWLH